MRVNWTKKTDHSLRGFALLLALALLLCGMAGLPGSARAEGNLFENEEVNRLIDENYQQVLEKSYAELHMPLSLHGITEEAFTANARDVASRLMENGYKAYVIGGCIRDFILGKESNDIDFVTDATLEQLQAIFGDAFQTHISSGNVYGGVSYPDEYVDLATFQNVPPHFAGLPGVPEFDPTVRYTDSALLDSFERDLTINAIYYDMSNGDLIDFHGGLHDIREGILKTMADARAVLPDNPLVALRALRFQARFGFKIDENLDAAIREMGPQVLSNLNQHTMYRNANWMMMTGNALDCYRLLAEYGLMDTIYPPIDGIMNGDEYRNYLEKALKYMDKLCLDRGETISNELALLAFLQPEIDRRARRSSYEKAVCGVLDEMEMSFELDDIRVRVEGISHLAHDMERASSRDMEGSVRRSEFFSDALALLNMKSLSDESLREQAAFWNEVAGWETDYTDKAA